ncbi:MAG TPA: DUF502 domain-containing protein [Vicinamibacteria bacterium]|nr:DUF502 domain-containing protein [Vicinamibacteria bacterium]
MRKLKIKRHIAAGLLVWVPLVVTFFSLRFVINVMDKTLLLIPAPLRPDNLLGFHIPGLGVILTFTLLLLTGSLAANILGRRFLDAWERFLARIPLVSWVYSGVKKVAETLLSPNGQSFRKVLLLEYPRKGLWSLAFQTASALDEVQARTEKEVICVFVPTTPNPTSGFILMVPRDEAIELDMSVDEALRMIISLGVVVPDWRRRHLVPVPQAAEEVTVP